MGVTNSPQSHKTQPDQLLTLFGRQRPRVKDNTHSKCVEGTCVFTVGSQKETNRQTPFLPLSPDSFLFTFTTKFLFQCILLLYLSP